MVELTDEQNKDVEDRKKAFIEEYTALTEKLQMDFTQWPVFVPNGKGMFSVMVNADLQDKKYLSPVSPFNT